MSTSSAALDLAHRSQTSPHGSFSGRSGEIRDASSEWPQYNGPPRSTDLNTRRNMMSVPPFDENSHGKQINTISASTVPAMQHPQGIHQGSPLTSTSRRGTPPVVLDALNGSSARSVPGTPLGFINGATSHLNKNPGTPHSPENTTFGPRVTPLTGQTHKLADNVGAVSDVHGSLSRQSGGQYDGSALSFNSIQTGLHDPLQVSFSSDTFCSYSICYSVAV